MCSRCLCPVITCTSTAAEPHLWNREELPHTTVCGAILKGVLLSQRFTQQLLSTAISPFSHSQTASSLPIYLTWDTDVLLFTAKPQDHKQMNSKSREVIPSQEFPGLYVSCSYLVLKISDNGHFKKHHTWLDGSVIQHFLQCSYTGSRKDLTGLHRLQHSPLCYSGDVISELWQMVEQRLPKHPDR